MNARTAETATVKAALVAAGYADAQVSHGRGTAYHWLTVKVSAPKSAGCTCTLDQWGIRETCAPCLAAWQAHYRRAIQITQAASGRRGEYDCIGADVELKEVTE